MIFCELQRPLFNYFKFLIDCKSGVLKHLTVTMTENDSRLPANVVIRWRTAGKS